MHAIARYLSEEQKDYILGKEWSYRRGSLITCVDGLDYCPLGLVVSQLTGNYQAYTTPGFEVAAWELAQQFPDELRGGGLYQAVIEFIDLVDGFDDDHGVWHPPVIRRKDELAEALGR